MKEETGVLEKTLRSTEIQLTYNDRRGDASDDHNFSVPTPPPPRQKKKKRIAQGILRRSLVQATDGNRKCTFCKPEQWSLSDFQTTSEKILNNMW